MTTPKASRKPPVRLRFGMRISVGNDDVIGPGKIALLEAIRTHGSISTAAKNLGMSYRRAWLLLDELNHCLKQPAVHSVKGGQSGGGSGLTPVGEELIRHYRSVETIAPASCAKSIQALLRLVRSDAPAGPAAQPASTAVPPG